jgi:8-oxo-dGTP diphosphatase
MKHIEVVAAVIMHENKILCVQRKESKYDYISKKYEFPGGKVEPNESLEAALKREILEELSKEISIEKFYLTVDYQYPDFRLTMHSYICSCEDYSITLNEHIDFKWLPKESLDNLDWAAADVPIVEMLLK